MSADLTGFAAEIQQLRDTAFEETVATHAAGDWRARGVSGTEWFAYARTLSVLYRCTDGRYGTPIDEQRSPYEVMNARSVEDRKAEHRGDRRAKQPADDSPIQPGKWYRQHTPAQLIAEHARRGIAFPAGALTDVQALADSLNADDRKAAQR